jgi:putative transposase
MTIKEQEEVSISRACRLTGVSRSAYNKWLKNPATDPGAGLRRLVREAALAHPCYGYRRVTAELRNRGTVVNHKQVRRLMREEGLMRHHKKRFKPRTTYSDHSLRVYANLAKNLRVTGINQLWVADITYVRLQKEFVYLSVVLDVYSRRCIGWALSRYIDTELALTALGKALMVRKDSNLSGLIHHSDQGVQYASHEYIDQLTWQGILPSMSRRGNPYDNAYAESFMKTFKYEEVHTQEYEDYDDAYQNIEVFIEEIYNETRLHSRIGYLPPNEYEKRANLSANVA